MKKKMIVLCTVLAMVVVSACAGEEAAPADANALGDVTEEVSGAAVNPDSEEQPKEEVKEEVKKEEAESKEALDFTLTDMDGNEVSLSDYKGKKNVFLMFWATWCPYCKKQMPHVQALLDEEREDLVVLAVSTDKSNVALTNWIERNQYTGIVMQDHRDPL
jgi:peroxiredoxin